MNSLDQLDMPGALICPQDVPAPMSEIRQQEMLMRYCKKPISGFGSFTSGLTSAYEQLVIDNELFALMYRTAQGVNVSPDHLAVEVIAKAMDGEGFVEQDHTLKYLRTGEVFQPRLGFDGLLSLWEAQGSKDIRARAKEEVHERLQAEVDDPLPPEVDREFQRIIAAAEAELL